jgi:hypothetical protein
MIFNRFAIISSLLAATAVAVPFVAEDFPLSAVPLSELPAPDTIPAPVNVTEPIKLMVRATEGIHLVNCQGNGYAYSIEIVGVPFLPQIAREAASEPNIKS